MKNILSGVLTGLIWYFGLYAHGYLYAKNPTGFEFWIVVIFTSIAFSPAMIWWYNIIKKILK
jgi:hypothetical protein